MGGHKTISHTSSPEQVAPPIIHDLIVAGVLTPDVTGYYDIHGYHDGQLLYKHITRTSYILYDLASGRYHISGSPYSVASPAWRAYQAGPIVEGPYGPYIGSSGIAIVNAVV